MSTSETITKTDLTNILNAVFSPEDSGWQNASLSSQFALYGTSASDQVKYRKVGKVVQIRGAVKPTSNIAGSDTLYRIFTLPEGYRPSIPLYFICQGSGNAVWMLEINTDGAVYFARYRYMNVSGFSQVTTSNWLPFSATYLVD